MKPLKLLATIGAVCFANSIYAQTNQPIYLQADAVVTLPTGAGLSALAMGDFNHDNQTDIAVCERSLGQVALYLRSTIGTYPSAAFTYAVGQAPSGLVSFNRDRNTYHADLMAISGPSSQWTMLRDDNDPTGNLTRRVLTPGFGGSDVSTRPQLIQVDYNLDGVPDFAYTYPIYYNSYIRCYSYYSDTYSPVNPTPAYPTPFFNTPRNTSSSITMADFDLDGRLDEVLPDSAESKVYFVKRFTTEMRVLQNNGLGPVHVSAQDIDNDQLADVAIAYSGSNEVAVMRTTTSFDFNRGYSYQLAASPRRVLLADLNRDGRPEMLVVTANNELLLYRHNGSNTALCYTTYPPQVLATGVNPAMLQTAFLDGDQYPDVLVGCPGDNTVRTYLTRLGQVTATQSTQLMLQAAVYPTPATTQVTIEQAKNIHFSATMLDEVGRVVRQIEVTGTTYTLSVADLPRGIYILRLRSAEGAKNTKLVLE